MGAAGAAGSSPSRRSRPCRPSRSSASPSTIAAGCASWGRFPWELVLIALSLLILQRLRSGGAVVVDRSLGTEAPSLLLFAFPLAFLAGFVALVARGWSWSCGGRGARSGGWGTPAYLAVHRLAARSRLTLLLIAAAGLCLGLFVQAQTVARSMGDHVDAKAGVYVGSDVQARIDSVNETPERFPLPLTRVVRRLQAGELRTAVPFDLLAIDTETFASTAFWDPAFSSEPLETLLDRVSRAVRGAASGRHGLGAERLPGLDHDRPADGADRDRRARDRLPRHDVAPAAGRGRRASASSTRSGLPNPLAGADASDELWIRGDPAAARAALAELTSRPTWS